MSNWISANDVHRSATVSHLPDLAHALDPMRGFSMSKMLDIGCGFGGLSKYIADELGMAYIAGVDIDPAVMDEARGKQVDVHLVDVSHEPLPFTDAAFDLIVTLGMMDYLPTYDALIREMYRVLRPGGYVLVALPNLGSWHNRLLLLLGYQPRDVEISSERSTGIAPWYTDREVTGHIHACTIPAFVELMSYHGFEKVGVTSGRPMRQPRPGLIVETVDRLLSSRPALARRFFYLGRKVVAETTARRHADPELT